MQTVLLIIHLLVVISLVTVILLQQNTSAGLGFGGDKDFMSARGKKTALTRLTAILGAIFFFISILLTVVANISNSGKSVLEHLPKAKTQAPASSAATSIKIDSSKAQAGKPIPLVIPDSVLDDIKKQKELEKKQKSK